MPRFNIVRNIRTVLWLLIVATIPLLLGGLYWANSTGLPEKWRNTLEQQMSNQGAHIRIASLTYIPLKGFVARGVTIFAEEERINEISNLERLHLVLDNTSLAAGKFRLRKVVLNNARLSLPVDPKEPTGQALYFNNVNASIYMPKNRIIKIEEARGNVGGIDVTLSAKLTAKGNGPKDPDYKKEEEGKRREVIAHILNELQHWTLDPDSPPTAHINITGNLNEKSTLNAQFRITASYLEKKQYRLKNLAAQGRLSGYLLTLDAFTAEDTQGSLTGHADYQIIKKDGRFDINSSIEIPNLLNSWLDSPLKTDLFLLAGKQQLQFAGEFKIPEKLPTEAQDPENPEKTAPASPKISVKLTGHALCESITLKGIPFTSAQSWFSWQNGNLFLRDMKLTRPDGTAEVEILKQGDIIRLSLHSTLPAAVFGPFFKGKPLEKVIADFSENKNPSTEIFIKGSLNLKDRTAWKYKGHGNIKNLSFRGIPLHAANCSFDLTRNKLDFFDGQATFDYTDYPLRKAHNGPSQATAQIGRILYNSINKTVTVEEVEGTVYAAPLVRLFSSNVAEILEAYRFHSPPKMSGSGIVDVGSQGRTNLNVKFTSTGEADYTLFSKNITLTAPSGNVNILGSKVHVKNLTAKAFGGDIKGEITTTPSTLTGEFSGSKLSVAGVSKTYNFGMKGGGTTTGRVEFNLRNGDISTMSGKGLIGLEKAELFSVPVFGPLSSVISKVLADRRAGFERAKSAFCTFSINKGIISTTDLQTATTSVNFTGDGLLDLNDRTINFTVRLNARGLLSIITLPLRPFSGLFQFRGTGPIKKSKWKRVSFSSPPPEQSKFLLSPTPKALIVPE